MIRIKQAVIVEGKYDKIRLSNIIDTLIITTDGFGVFKNKQKTELIKLIAEKQGIILMTDSDSAGFMIRNHLNNIVKNGQIIHIYLPEIAGKERRKAHASAEGLLGVEGTDDRMILDALVKAGVTGDPTPKGEVTKAMLYADGFIGQPGCSERRQQLLQALGIPKAVSPNMLPKVITQLAGEAGYRQAADSLSINFGQNT